MSIQTNQPHEEDEGLLFHCDEPHLLSLAIKIAQEDAVKYEQVGSNDLFLYRKDYRIGEKIQATLNSYIHDSKQHRGYR